MKISCFSPDDEWLLDKIRCRRVDPTHTGGSHLISLDLHWLCSAHAASYSGANFSSSISLMLFILGRKPFYGTGRHQIYWIVQIPPLPFDATFDATGREDGGGQGHAKFEAT